MIEFEGKILVIGCGSIAQCTLPMIIKQIRMPAKNILIIDFEDKRHKIKSVLEKGAQYLQQRITKENYQDILSEHLSQGDICLDLAWNLDTCAFIDWCHHHGVLYLNTCVELWDPSEAHHPTKSPAERTLYVRHMALRRMVQQWKNKQGPTAIVDHGANPGLVSHFTKKALLEISKKIRLNGCSQERIQLLKAAEAQKNFATLAYLTGVKTIHISERDTQAANTPKKPNEFVNTWSIPGFIEEGMAPAEIGWGTHEKTLPSNTVQHQEGPKNQIFINQKGVETYVRSWVPSSGEITGMLVRHGEAFSISDSLTVWKENQVIYRPTVHYAYQPCEQALSSIHELKIRNYQAQQQQRILQNEIISGVDELGCLLMGHDLKAWWIGTILDIHTARNLVPEQNATSVQVAAGVLSALIYMIRHPSLGFCLPDHLDHQEILKIAMPYLGRFVSIPVDWSPNPVPENQWQFSSFLKSI